MVAPSANICQKCGACCASFRVSFYWAEAVELGLPDCLVERVGAHLGCLAGTNQPALRCRALEGEVGQSVSCTVYCQRPSPCHDVQIGDEKCSRARAKHGLPPLEAPPAAGQDAWSR